MSRWRFVLDEIPVYVVTDLVTLLVSLQTLKITSKKVRKNSFNLEMTIHGSYLIKVDVNGPNIGSTDSSHREKAMLPLTIVHHSLVEIKQTFDSSSYHR